MLYLELLGRNKHFTMVYYHIESTNFYSSQKPGAFNTKCVQLIGKCFRDLEKLSIGGYDVDLSSLVFIGK